VNDRRSAERTGVKRDDVSDVTTTTTTTTRDATT